MNQNLFDWIDPQLRAAIDAFYEPIVPWRAFRFPVPRQPNVADLLNRGDRIQIIWAKGTPRDKVVTLPLQPVFVRQVVPCIYARSARWAIACDCLYPDRINEVKGWCIQYSQLYQEWEIRKQHRLGQKLNTKAGDAKDRTQWSPPFVANGGRILSLVYGLSVVEDCEVKVVEKFTQLQQMELWNAV
ncbi:MAG: hypothetical protein CLLPBCKN_007125 [Chroococcidiopsis cubana SAG 39.79]|uniref:Uncharacterized protein n=2 Tax=Chroococcidiopsis TaxID=54298 RepID=A0AB37U901_9CYAN|nr:hypothetical protein [Chroococcidiopsis cubana]MDZ4877690.1 hypothetical protein [Chroococcidiopsis cubana SAG 39.79]RUS97063.1 hypothetical protein DSM107010_70200 [Chroococcidiopsis cubana SAG 39.79]